MKGFCPTTTPKNLRSEKGCLLKMTKLFIAKRNGKGNTSALPVCAVALSVVEVRPCSYPFRLNVVGSYLIGVPDLPE